MKCPAIRADFLKIILIGQSFGEIWAENLHFPLSWQPVGHFDPPKTICWIAALLALPCRKGTYGTGVTTPNRIPRVPGKTQKMVLYK